MPHRDGCWRHVNDILGTLPIMPDLINQLFTTELDRALAKSWAAKLNADGLKSRTEVLLREVAGLTRRAEGGGITPEAARAYMADFANVIGVTEADVASSVSWLDTATPEPAAPGTAEQEVDAAPPPAQGEPVSPAPPSPSDDARRRGDIEALMRQDGGRAYWRDEAVQAEYRDILSRAAPSTWPPTVSPAQAPAPGSNRPLRLKLERR